MRVGAFSKLMANLFRYDRRMFQGQSTRRTSRKRRLERGNFDDGWTNQRGKEAFARGVCFCSVACSKAFPFPYVASVWFFRVDKSHKRSQICDKPLETIRLIPEIFSLNCQIQRASRLFAGPVDRDHYVDEHIYTVVSSVRQIPCPPDLRRAHTIKGVRADF